MKLLATIVLLLFLVACGDFDLETEPGTAQSQPTFHPDPTPTSTPALSPTITPTPTFTPAPTAYAAPTKAPTSTAVPTQTPTVTPVPVALVIAPVPADLRDYNRRDWRHWIDEDGDCQNARHEVLVAESLVEVTFKTDRQCQVVSGEWIGAFTGTTVTEASKLDIYHMVPLANAHRSGGHAWTPERKRAYANDLTSDAHLIAVTSSANRSKGARGPDQWRPPDEGYWCEYATDWASIKTTWGLTATPAEAEAVSEMLETCLE